MRQILVATDGSPAADAAFDEALELATETGSGIAVLTVWRALQGDFGVAYPPTAVLPEMLEAERNHAEATLALAATRAADHGVQIVTRLAAGDPAETICAYADEIHAKLIAVGTRGHSTVATLLLGSVSLAVVRHAPCPVLVVRDPNRPSGSTQAARSPQGVHPTRPAENEAHAVRQRGISNTP